MPKMFMISGGGTGGHIFPALAIADELKARYPFAEFQFVGAKDRMEMERVPKAGYTIHGLWISGLQRKLTFSNLLFPLKLVLSVWKCKRLLKKYKPQVVIGTGGYASGPLLYAASKMKIPCLLQEQNSYPGITNKVLSRWAKKICVAYPDMQAFFPKEKIVLTGNPIRKGIGNLYKAEQARGELGISKSKPTILVLGGSLGSKRINELISECLSGIDIMNVNLIWQCGKIYYEGLRKKHPLLDPIKVVLTDFLADMNQAFSAADIVISRSGAGTLSELAVVGKASILIPSPNVAEDHQTKNAKSFQYRNAALVFEEDRSPNELLDEIYKILEDKGEKQSLEKNIKSLALPKAAKAIADEIDKLL